ncbi:MAG TPA: sigma 54-interacting transcriptional regulator [Kofleriaceae bacterium]|nr:sigma 54-interacting transcriptional regulator [Kofleriaceae bacterium]
MHDDASTVISRGGRGPVRRVLVAMLDDGVKTHELPAAGEIVVGRGRTAQIRIDHPSVSREHAAIELGDAIRVRDLGSANGSTLRGARLPERRAVEVGANEAFQLGDVTVVVQERRATLPAPAAPPGPRGPAIAPVILDPAMKNLFDLARRVAQGTINVLVVGESGAGKEVLARAIHAASPRARGPLIEVNCGAISETLIESELFGHDKGAFTGAVAAKQGLIAAADGGTLFLDEVGELSPGAQAKLLRVIEDKRVMRVGSTETRPVDLRVVAATNRELETSGFRTDLYFRLAGIVLEVPPLRERAIEIEPLARAFAAAAAAPLERPTPAFAPDALAALAAHDWPGNVRELRNAVERAVLLADGAITRDDLFGKLTPKAAPPAPAIDDERARIIAALEQCAGNQTRAAELLGMPRRTLVKRLGQYAIPRPKRR